MWYMWHPAALACWCPHDTMRCLRLASLMSVGNCQPVSQADVQKAPVVSTEKREHAKPGEEQNQVAIIQNCKAKGICWKGGWPSFDTVCCDWASQGDEEPRSGRHLSRPQSTMMWKMALQTRGSACSLLIYLLMNPTRWIRQRKVL